MLKLHFAPNSRAGRIVWLLEELELPYDINKIIKDVRETSVPMALFNSELDLKSISDSLKALSIREIEIGFRSLRENDPPRHDFNSFSFKNITNLDKKLDTY